MGSTVAPKMFSQPGVFGTSDTTGVVNKTNPMAGIEAASARPSTLAMVNQAQSPAPTATAPVTMPDATIAPPLLPVRSFGMRSRLMGPEAAFYGQ